MSKSILPKASDMLKFNDFVTVISDNLEVNGVKKGTRMFIAGTITLPTSEDGYSQRIYMNTCPVYNDIVDTNLILLVDPKELKKVGKAAQKRAEAKMSNQKFAQAPVNVMSVGAPEETANEG